MFESLPAQETSLVTSPTLVDDNSIDRPPYLDATTLMKEKNCFFVHTIQVTKNIDVSENNKSIDTNTLDVASKLDILYAAQPTLSTSTVRPHTEDGMFHGGFGVIFSQGEIVSANPSDDGTIAKSLGEREIIGGSKNTEEDIVRAIERPQYGKGRSYNEIVLKKPEVAGGFMKIDDNNDITYEEEIMDYGKGGGEVIRKIGVINMQNQYAPGWGGRKPDLMKGFDVAFSTLLEMKSRGPVFVMDDANQMYQVSRIDETTRKVEFSTTPITPYDIAEVYGERAQNKYLKQEMLDRVASKGVTLH